MITEIDDNTHIISTEREEEEFSESTNHSFENIAQEESLIPLEQISLEVLDKNEQIPSKVRIIYVNDDVYEGEVNFQGLKEGWGIYLYNNSEKYEGFWQNNKIHGYGKYYFKGGENYEGDWYEGRKEGVGILKMNKGDQYQGEFYKDDFDGKGTYFYVNGEKFEGEWKDGKKNGMGTFFGKERKIIGEWIEDELQHF